MPKRSGKNLGEYWSGIHRSLDGRLSSVKDYLRHPSSGFSVETYFRDLLREYLPGRYAIESGFVVNADGDRSDLADMLIVDAQNIPPLSAESHFKVFPAEAVLGAIEITAAPRARVRRAGVEGTIPKLEDDILKLAKIRSIATEREYIVPVQAFEGAVLKYVNVPYRYKLSPRSFLITCGDEWVNAKTYEKNLLAALHAAHEKRAGVWLNAAFSMRHGMFHFKPHTQFKHSRISQNPLLEFVLFINVVIAEFRTSHIDIRRYRPTIPVEAEKSDSG